MNDKRIFLRIKFNNLMDEAHLIRKYERRAHAHGNIPLMNELRNHRVLVVRQQSRLTHLALGFIKGKTLVQMEGEHPSNDDRLNYQQWVAINKMLKQYGPKGLHVGPWMDGSERVRKPAA